MGRGIDSRNRVWNWVAKLHRLACWYDNPMPTWFLAPIAGIKLLSLDTYAGGINNVVFVSNEIFWSANCAIVEAEEVLTVLNRSNASNVPQQQAVSSKPAQVLAAIASAQHLDFLAMAQLHITSQAVDVSTGVFRPLVSAQMREAVF